jgi:hypothetical protein
MSPKKFHLAQFNIARTRAPIDEPSWRASALSSTGSTSWPTRARGFSGGSRRREAMLARLTRSLASANVPLSTYAGEAMGYHVLQWI